MRVLPVTLVIVFCWATLTFGQGIPCEGQTVWINGEGEAIVSYVEKMPSLIGGFEPYMKWIKDHMDKKLKSKRNEQKRKVYVGFVVHEDGSISNFTIDKGIGDPYDSEAIRLIRDNPQTWVAGLCGNRKVKARMTMPVEF